MGIDTMVFVADIPAGSYTRGDAIAFIQKSGPAVVRQGLGEPALKSINTGALFRSTATGAVVRYSVQNSNWNDPVMNGPSTLNDVTGMSQDATGYQPGNNCKLQVNSAFTVGATWIQDTTTTADNTLFITIDIEYPDIPGLQNPAGEEGTPCSILYENPSCTINAFGTAASAAWDDISFDKFKAGYRYLMQKLSVEVESGTTWGFVKFSGGASMGGLARVVPVTSLVASVGKVIEYTAPEVKGPFTLSWMMFGASNTTAAVDVLVDYVKRE